MDIFYTIIDENPNKKLHQQFQHQTGRKLIEYAAKNIYKIENTEIEIVNNKPKFKFSDKKFSISHSKNVVAVCFDDEEVGVDIEYIAPRDYISIAKRMNFKLENDSLEAFYKAWTQYEAVYKLGDNPKIEYNCRFLNSYYLSAASVSDNKTIEIKKLIF